MEATARICIGTTALALLAGCPPPVANPAPVAADFDRPVPASERRAELRLRVDLEPAVDCEERFDLALYRDRTVELVRWDERRGTCLDRTVTLVYLSRQRSAAELRAAVAKLARAARPVEP